jgi:hypothetical protein
MWDYILDAGAEGIARTLNEDIRAYRDLGISGITSIQIQRNACPSSIAMTVMGKTLWNDSADFDEIRRELYAHTFGEEYTDVMCDYFSALSRAFNVGIMRGVATLDKDEFRRNMNAALCAMDSFGEVIEKNLDREDPCQRDSWRYLAHHRRAYSLIGRAVLLILDGKRTEGEALIAEAGNYVWENEREIQAVFDGRNFDYTTKEQILIDKAPTVV